MAARRLVAVAVSGAVHLAVGSRLENVELVRAAIDAVLDGFELDDDTARQIDLAMREAVVNAMRHGNGDDPERTVEVDCSVDDGVLTLRVRDEGPGFDPESVPDPLDDENLHRTSGRGLLFMRQCMDTVDYTFRPGEGTMVTMTKAIGPSPRRARPMEEE